MYSIPEIASQLIDKDISKSREDNTKTLILVGSKSVVSLHEFYLQTPHHCLYTFVTMSIYSELSMLNRTGVKPLAALSGPVKSFISQLFPCTKPRVHLNKNKIAIYF